MASTRKENEHQDSIPQDDDALEKREIDEMFSQEEEEGLNLYNAAPLFTGGIIFVVSIAATAYLFYAGLTGDDPLMGHPK